MGNETENNLEIVEHIIEIDNYVSVTLRIPKRLSAIELKALMYKSNKLFNLSETPLVEKRGYKRKYLKGDERKVFVEKYDKASDEEKQKMAQDMGIGDKSLYQRIWKIKKEFGIITPRQNIKKYSDDTVKKMVDMIKDGNSISYIVDKINLTERVVRDVLRSRTGKSLKELRESLK